MHTRDFLTALLPNAGYIIVAHPWQFEREGKLITSWNNVAFQQIDAALGACDQWGFEHRDVYFAMSTYREPKVWNPKAINPRTKTPGKWERRTRSNAYAIKCLFLDIDVKDLPPEHTDYDHTYRTQADALADVRRLCTALHFPRPTIVNSGYGIHLYWQLEVSVLPDVWQPVAEKLKAVCLAMGIRIDAKVTADAARVLRVPNTFNFKRNAVAPVEVMLQGKPESIDLLDARLQRYIDGNDVPEAAPGKRKVVPIIALPMSDVESNIGVTNDPLNFDAILFGCAALQNQFLDRGAGASEPQWRAALGLTRFCEPMLPAMRAVSDGHAAFDEDAMVAKVANWSYGPSKCASFWNEDNATCEACPSWQKITSPAQMGRMIHEAATPLVQVESGGVVIEEKFVPPPSPYKRRVVEGKTVIAFKTEDSEGNTTHETICPYDLYPVRILRQTGDDVEETSVWRMELPQLGLTDVPIPHKILADNRALNSFLYSKGLYLNAKDSQATQFFMTAYIRSLSEVVARDKVYDRLGWHDDHRTFVLPRAAYHRDGSISPHNPSRHIQAVTKNAIREEGVFEIWLDGMDFYQGDGNAGFRTLVYAAIAAPIFHLTGHKGVLIAATGDTGRGKSTCLEACASLWGDPEPLLVSGGADGTTTNALYSILGTYHSLPLLWDETTEREADEMRRFLLNISQGKGKERMKGSEHDGRVVTWETIVISSANTDDVSRILSSGKDTDPHLMRLISVEFDAIDRGTDAKLRADDFKRKIRTHFGHAGVRYLRYVVDNYEDIKRLVVQNMRMVDQLAGAQSQERLWTAAVAALYTAAQIAHRIGILRYDYKADLKWMLKHIARMRATFTEAHTSSTEIVSDFLEQHTASMLVLSSNQVRNIDNIAVRPSRALLIRHEMDDGIIYISKTAIRDYCAKHKANFRKLENDLVREGALKERNCRKILGADTPYAKGQSRCWMLLEGKLNAVATAQTLIAQQQSIPVRALK